MNRWYKVLTFDGRCVSTCLEDRIVLSETNTPDLLPENTTMSDLERDARKLYKEPWVQHVIDNIRKCDLIKVELKIVLKPGEI